MRPPTEEKSGPLKIALTLPLPPGKPAFMVSVTRRSFLTASAGAALAPFALPGAPLPRDLHITRITGFRIPSPRPKMIGKNSRRDVHGNTATDPIIRVYTNAGIEGLGWCRAKPEELQALIGGRLSEFFDQQKPAMISPLNANSMALWDIAGKLLEKPVYRLLGATERPRVRGAFPGHEGGTRGDAQRPPPDQGWPGGDFPSGARSAFKGDFRRLVPRFPV